MPPKATGQNNPTIFDGSMDWSGGVNSLKVTTISSPRTPNGLARNELAWLVNGTVRDGGITPRSGCVYKGTIVPGSSLYQGASIYEPDGANPYIMALIGGNTYQIDPDFVVAPITLTAQFPGTAMPATQPQANFAQGEEFLVIQAGDNVTLPLFWDGTTLRRSNGLSSSTPPIGSYSLTTPVAWTVPAAGQEVTVTLSQPYPGSPGDVLTWTAYGTFTVIGSTGNTITLVTVNSTVTGSTVLPATYSVGVMPGVAGAVYTVNVVSVFGPNPQAVGNTSQILLAAPYGGNVGDTVNWIGVGTYAVLGVFGNYVAFQAVSNLQGAAQPTGAGQTWISIPPASPSGNVTTQPTTNTSPAVNGDNQTLNIGFTAPYTGPGLTNDTIYWIGVGVFKLLGVSAAGTTLSLLGVHFFNSPGGMPAQQPYLFVESGPSTAPPPTTPTPELPAATAMVYYQGRIWYAMGRTVSAGDIVGGPSGTPPYNFRDSILKVTENPLAIGGDGFSVPTNAGDIRGLSFFATLDTTLGQGNLIIFTRKSVYSLYVPITRADWIAASASNAPLMTVVQNTNGGVNDRSIVAQNGDLYFQSLEPSIRSLISALRYFQQWANPPTSSNENRILEFVNRSLMHFGSGIAFDNRLLQATLPIQKPQGCIHQAILPLDFTPLSTLNAQRPPNWEGHYEGLDFLQLLEMDFGGLQRAFAIVLSRLDQSIQLWEFVTGQTTDVQAGGQEARITMQIEFPAFTAGDEDLLKRLTGAELFIDSVYGTVDFNLEYRPDFDTCWHAWKQWRICSPRNSCETVENPVCYPLTPFGESYRSSQTIPVPPQEDCESSTGRPAYIFYQCQPRLTVTGYCRIRGIRLFMEAMERELYAGLVCG